MEIDINVIVAAVTGALVGIVAMYFAVRAGLVAIGNAIPGDDFADRAVAKMNETTDPWFRRLEDLLRKDTGKGVGTPSDPNSGSPS